MIASPLGAAAAPLRQTQPAAESPLSRIDDFPPDDFQAVIGWTGGGGGGSEGRSCVLRASGQMEMQTESGLDYEPCVLGLNDILVPILHDELVAGGWTRDPPPDFEVHRPDGSSLLQTQDEFGNLVWSIALDAPLGTYTLVASQGPDHQAQGAFRVAERSHQPVVRVRLHQPLHGEASLDTFGTGPQPVSLDEQTATRPGQAVDVVLAGFAPNQSVRLLLYDVAFRTTLGAVQVDGAGRAVYALQTSVDDPQGVYRIQSIPAARRIDFGRDPGFMLIEPEAPDAGVIHDLRGSISGPGSGDQETRFYRRLASQADHVWAAVAAQAGAPVEDLECVFAGDLLDTQRNDLLTIKQAGQYVVARETAPPTVLQVSGGIPYAGDTSGVDVVSHLSLQAYNADGSLASDNSGDFRHRYTVLAAYPLRRTQVSAAPACGDGFLVERDE